MSPNLSALTSLKGKLGSPVQEEVTDNHHDDIIGTERNSVIEFEMLEKECIARYQKTQ
jgi:hypothetical protein